MLTKARDAAMAALMRIYRSPRGKWLIGVTLRTPPGRHLAHVVVRNARSVQTRRLGVEVIQGLGGTREARAAFVRLARRRFEANRRDEICFDILAVALVYSEDQEGAWSVLFSDVAERFVADEPSGSSVLEARVSICHELESYAVACEQARRATTVAPELLRARLGYLKSAFAAGKMLRQSDAIEYFGRQYMTFEEHPGAATEREIEKTERTIGNACLHTLKEHLDFLELTGHDNPTVGIFFLSSTEALGHAVLDPYHFLALHRVDFDHVVLLGPPRSSYRPASRACLQIVEQYGEYLETGSDMLLNLSWMSLGHHRIGPLTLVVDHYWSLLRDVVHRTRDERDAFRHNAWHFTLPQYYEEVGEAFCARYGIDLERPLVVMHVRDEGYHGIARQSFRNCDIDSYRDAVEYLLDRGYQVVRVGDRKMPRLELRSPDYLELPFCKGYRHEIDPFLISRSRFMIGCQSGPCAFARVLGVPILTVNAVLHYTLLPSTMEMACFKRYYRIDSTGRKTELSLEAAMDARADQLDNSHQLARAGIVVETVTAEEILAATRDMDAWVDDPAVPETAAQQRFRERAELQTRVLSAERDGLPAPIADYLGICLAGYRISPTVADLRSGRETTPAAAPAPLESDALVQYAG